MDKYNKLILNTVILAIGTFGSKVLVFLLMPLYTRVLTPGDYGVVDLLVQTSNLLIPIVSAGITNAIIRFGLDKNYDKRDIFTSGLFVICCGYAVFVLIYPAVSQIEMLGGHTLLIYLYVLTSSLRSLCSQFVRARELVRLYAFDGMLSTFMVLVLNILFLVGLKMGITGYLLATILSDFLSAAFLFWIAGLRRYIRPHRPFLPILGEMLRYCAPLIPTTIFWWITNVSDRYIVTHLLGSDANGLYAVAYKIPTLIILVSGIFSDAWQMSAVTESGSDRDTFFSTVAQTYQSVIFSAASGLILFAKPIMYLLVEKAYFEAWRYIPPLVLATVFSCLVTFLGSVYMVEKRSVATLTTTIIGAAANLVINFVLIPLYGVDGAAFATFISYFLVFVLRALHTRSMVRIRWNLPKLLLNLALVLAQTWALLTFETNWVLPVLALCALTCLLNLRMLLSAVQKVLRRRRN